MAARLKDALLVAFIAAILALPLAGARVADGLDGSTVEWRLADVGVAALLVFLGRLFLNLITDGHGKLVGPLAFFAAIAALGLPFPTPFLKSVAVFGGFGLAARALAVLLGPSWRKGKWSSTLTGMTSKAKFISYILILAALIFPFMPFASRYAVDVTIMVLTYVMLAWGLNITVGYAGLLDLGYAGFYALGAYSFALLAQYTGIGFWAALPISALVAVCAALLLGLPVLRLRGDYFAVVTLGFGEIVRLVLTNWTHFTNGPNGISSIPRPTLFGLEFAREAEEGHRTFNEFFHLDFDPMQRVIFLYYIILALALAVGWFGRRLRVLPLGRAWEAYRENEIACAALGINRWWIKLAAYSMGAGVAGLAGAFFATRQGFISPESFTFTESATMLAIVIMGGIGHPLGIALAAAFIIGMPELFRELEQYRMIAFGAGMVLIMLWRPGGLISAREPTVFLPAEPEPVAPKPVPASK